MISTFPGPGMPPVRGLFAVRHLRARRRVHSISRLALCLALAGSPVVGLSQQSLQVLSSGAEGTEIDTTTSSVAGTGCGSKVGSSSSIAVYPYSTTYEYQTIPGVYRVDGQWKPFTIAFDQSGSTAGDVYKATLTHTLSPDGTYTVIGTSFNRTTSAEGIENNKIDDTLTIDLNTGQWEQITIEDLQEEYATGCNASAHFTGNLQGRQFLSYDPGPQPETLEFVNPAIGPSGVPQATVVDASTVAQAQSASSIAADGASAVVVLYQSPSDSPVDFSLTSTGADGNVGGLSQFDPSYLTSPSPSSDYQVKVTEPINESECNPSSSSSSSDTAPQCIFLALLWAPGDMPAKGVNKLVTLIVTAEQNDSNSSTPSTTQNVLLLEPPPLVLVHGIWSSAGAWDAFKSWLGDNYVGQVVTAANYERTNSLAFNDPSIQQALALAIQESLTAAADIGLAATRVDVVAHSMGGLVTREFMTHGPPVPYSTATLSNTSVHKLITVGTPHLGSKLATVLDEHQNDLPVLVNGLPPTFMACMAAKVFGKGCTLASVLASQDMKVGAGSEALEPGSKALLGLSDATPYYSMTGLSPLLPHSYTEKELDALLTAYVPGETVDSILGAPNDTIVAAASQKGTPVESATIQDTVHTKLFGDDPAIAEVNAPAMWNQAVFWLMGGSGDASSIAEPAISPVPHKPDLEATAAPSSAPAPIFDLTGYKLAPESDISISPDSGSTLAINAPVSIAAAPNGKTLIEFALFQDVQDPSDSPLQVTTQAPWSLPFTPARPGKAAFTAFAVFSDKTYREVPLTYNVQTSGNPLWLSLSAPASVLPVGITTTVQAQANFSGGPVDVTSQATYSSRNGDKVFSIKPNGAIVTTGKGIDWLDAAFGGSTASAQISVGSCTYSLAPTNQLIEYSGGTATVHVTTQDGCSWIANAGAGSWLTASRKGKGSGAFTVPVGENYSGQTRIAFVSIAGHDVAITQPAATCTFSLSTTQIQAPASGAIGTILSASQCPVVAIPSQPWVITTVGAPAGDASSDPVYYSIAANPGTSSRSATIRVGSAVANIFQKGNGQKAEPNRHPVSPPIGNPPK